VVRTRNLDLGLPLEDDEVARLSKSAWKYEEEGRNLVGRGAVVTEHRIIGALKTEPYALALFDILRRHHWGREFAVVNSWAESLGWPRRQFKGARTKLIELGLVQVVRQGGYRSPSSYRLVNRMG